MSFSIRRLSGLDFARMAPDLVDLYITAMRYPRSLRDQRVSVWRRETSYPGFKAVAAFTETGVLAGVAYGFNGTPDRWWDQQLRVGLRQQSVPDHICRQLTSNYFEVAEIHVAPELQGQGTGRALIHELLAHTGRKYVLLSTPEVPAEANAAFGLYRSLGFNDVLRDFLYAGDSRPFAVLGRTLPLSSESVEWPLW
nr:ribosomal-protein-alanine N-acetyltransferase [Streptococcus thermophilus]